MTESQIQASPAKVDGCLQQVARQEIAQANSEKVKAQQDLHEFQIEQMRHNEVKQSAPTPQPPAASHAAPEADGVQGVISGLEQQKIGASFAKAFCSVRLDLPRCVTTGLPGQSGEGPWKGAGL